ncbi:MAG: VanZ family protein [Rhodoferax sp.]
MNRPNFSVHYKLSFWTLVLLTLWLSLVPVDQLPSELHFWDKAQHALGFAALAFLGLLAYPGRTLSLLVGLVLFGAGIECAQALSGWRQGDLLDWLADIAGLLIGSLTLYAVRMLFKTRD